MDHCVTCCKQVYKNALLLKVLNFSFLMKESDEILRSNSGYQLVVITIILSIWKDFHF